MSGKRCEPARRRLRPEDRRALILAAASEIFAVQGYEKASVRAIAHAAGVTTPVLYDHFGSKSELYGAAVRLLGEDLLAHWARQPAVIPHELFSATIDAIFSWIEQHEQGWRLLFGNPPMDPAVVEIHRRVQEQATRALTRLFGQLPELNLSTELDRARAETLLAEGAKSAVNAVAAWWWDNRDVPREQIVGLVSDLLWRGLRATTSPSTDPSPPTG